MKLAPAEVPDIMEQASTLEGFPIKDQTEVCRTTAMHAGGDMAEAQQNAEENEPSTTQEVFMNEVKNVLEELDEKRESDKKLVDEFRSKMNQMIDEVCSQIEQRLAARYEKTNTHVQSKIDYMNEILSRVTVLEQELADFNSAVGVFFQEPPK